MRHDTLGFLLADASRMMRRAFQQAMQDSALTLTLAQARALVYVARHEGLRQVELAEVLEVQPITLARLIDQLGGAGLVERRPDPSDRRAYRLFPTPAAAPQLAEIERVAKAIRRQALRGLDARQSAMLLPVLSRIRDNLSLR